ncbi:MAG: 4-(cytidine 5'-diphospho)-2-C-methyl-D-erythritol kinase [Bacteroidetes bacterium GWF2_33_16]|nr:MAG: 4-(cytidine 5'-diphospho)-2-C-methyl-D-erythritol kinase [Bacteroidetes bacterium GWE2_32_14]OFY06824.1 MAG: 4-(cytidine 5'-diphospho)-2-C-methyl-D-erythritol kinase [Bacteroidetes bacterium GWF2_33_16]
MIVFPNAKINIGLNIVAKRDDGYHDIETIFFPIGFRDILEINTSDRDFSFVNSGIIIEQGNAANNICYKAYNIVKEEHLIIPVNIHLHKIIPSGAGLGGGSSDGSFTLKVINSLQHLHIDDFTLINYAGKLGSDCPFFMLNKPVFATGTGNIFESISINLNNYYLVIINPGIHINTAKAYSQTKPVKPKHSLKELIENPIEKWRGLIYNDFEPVIFKDYPQIENVKHQLYNEGAVYASMSGSGSSVFGLFKEKPYLQKIFEKQLIWEELL